MDTSYYLDIFRNTAKQLDKKLLAKKQVEIAVGTYGDSVVLKLFKKTWTNDPDEPVLTGPRIFFSIWIGDDAIKEEKILYNIHALQLRKLKAYKLTSRKFAGDFRLKFRDVEHQWPNVRTNFGPLTLMEGWVTTGEVSLQPVILKLCRQFLAIDHFIDGLLEDGRLIKRVKKK